MQWRSFKAIPRIGNRFVHVSMRVEAMRVEKLGASDMALVEFARFL